MLELILLLVYLTRLVALARSRGRSWAWALGGLAVWLSADAVGLALFPHARLLASAVALPLAGLCGLLYYHRVRALPVVVPQTRFGRGDNFPCPSCASLQTEDLAGHLECHACGSAFGRT
jgi:hypothetical protein